MEEGDNPFLPGGFWGPFPTRRVGGYPFLVIFPNPEDPQGEIYNNASATPIIADQIAINQNRCTTWGSDQPNSSKWW